MKSEFERTDNGTPKTANHKSECGRLFDEIFTQHHSPNRNDERMVKERRRNYGTVWK